MSRERVRRDLAQNIKCAAIRIKVTGLVMFMDAPTRHHTIVHAAADLMGRALYTHEHEQGFLTPTGRYIDRRQAAKLCGREGELFTEDLW